MTAAKRQKAISPTPTGNAVVTGVSPALDGPGRGLNIHQLDNVHTPNSKSTAIKRAYVRSPSESNRALLRTILRGVRHEFVRDFVVIEQFGTASSPSTILHLPSGRWRGFTLPYQRARRMLNEHPEQDQDLVSMVFEVFPDEKGVQM